MNKKITKERFTEIMSEAVLDEATEMSEKKGAGMAAMAITLMGMSIMHKTLERLFTEGETEIEIITDKE